MLEGSVEEPVHCWYSMSGHGVLDLVFIFIVQREILTGTRHIIFSIVREENTIYAFPFVFFAMKFQTSLLALEKTLLVFVETLEGYALLDWTASRVALMLTKQDVVRKRGTAAMTLWWQNVAAVEMLPGCC